MIDTATIVRRARGWLGTPYHHQASVKGVGCDCLGLIRGLWRELCGPEPGLVLGVRRLIRDLKRDRAED